MLVKGIRAPGLPIWLQAEARQADGAVFCPGGGSPGIGFEGGACPSFLLGDKMSIFNLLQIDWVRSGKRVWTRLTRFGARLLGTRARANNGWESMGC